MTSPANLSLLTGEKKLKIHKKKCQDKKKIKRTI